MPQPAEPAPPDCITIDATLDVPGAVALRPVLLDRLATGGTFRIDLSAETPTAPALQIAAALRASLRPDGRFAGFGPIAERAFGSAAEGKA